MTRTRKHSDHRGHTQRTRHVLALALCLGVASGCATNTGPYAPQTESMRDSLKAQELTQKAAALVEKDAAKAESLLRDALTADLYHGPAHNNLGVLFLKRGDLYSAASEFEWAKKLMPGHPDPRLNLALTLEKAGRVDEALTTYASSLEVYEDHMPTIQAMTRLQIKTGKTTDRTKFQLDEIALKGESQRWREWAHAQRIGAAKFTPP